MGKGCYPDATGGEPSARVDDEDTDDLTAVLASLERDPALKLTDSGRALLHWLASHTLSRDDTGVIATVPPHCANLVADIARHNAAIWQELADVVEQLSPEAT